MLGFTDSVKLQTSTPRFLLNEQNQKGLSNAQKVFQTSKLLYEESFALVKDHFSFPICQKPENSNSNLHSKFS